MKLKLFIGALLMLLVAVFSTQAQLNYAGDTSLIKYARVFPLTNTTTFKLSLAPTNLATASWTIINSQPFPVQPGKGFAVHLEFVGTNAGTADVVPYFQIATPITNGSTFTTNWSRYIAGPTMNMAGTTRVYGWGLVANTTIDHAQLCRLAVVSNAHTASVLLSPTNTYVVIQP